MTAAAWTTWALAGLALLGMLLTVLSLAVVRDQVIEQIEQDPNFVDSNLSTGDLVAVLWVVVVIMTVWAIAAIVLAWFAFRRANWARITLVVSAAMTALFTLMASASGAVVLVVFMLGAVAVVVLLFTGGANQWYASRRRDQGFPGSFQPYGGQGQQTPQYGDSSGRPGPEDSRGDRGKDEPPSNVW